MRSQFDAWRAGRQANRLPIDIFSNDISGSERESRLTGRPDSNFAEATLSGAGTLS